MKKITFALVFLGLLLLSTTHALTPKSEDDDAVDQVDVPTVEPNPEEDEQEVQEADGEESSAHKKADRTASTTETEPEEIIEPTGVDIQEDRTEILKEWEELMEGFEPDEMLTFEIEPKSEEIFMEDITIPTMIRGAFFSSYYSMENIDFSIRDPAKNRIYYKLDKREGVFSVNVTDIGAYSFIFSNIKGKDKKFVTFTIDVHNTTEVHLTPTDLDPVETIVSHVASQVRDTLNEQKFAAKRQTTQLEAIEVAHSKLMTYSIIEIIIVILTSSWQVYYIKKILDNKRMI